MCVHPNEDRLLQRTVCWTTRLYARATTTSSSRCCPLRCRSQSTKPCHRSPWTPLAACTLSYYVQTMYPHAWSGIWSRSAVLIWHDAACVSTCRPISSALSAQLLTTRREYARRLVPDRFRLPTRTHGTKCLQTFARSPPFPLLNNTSRHIFSTLLTFI